MQYLRDSLKDIELHLKVEELKKARRLEKQRAIQAENDRKLRREKEAAELKIKKAKEAKEAKEAAEKKA